MSLTNWFTEYIYIPLGGNRRGNFIWCRNILTVFVISGLWHGAGWNFVLWGVIHAFYQIVGHYKEKIKKIFNFNSVMGKIGGVAIIFLLVTFAWIFLECNH